MTSPEPAQPCAEPIDLPGCRPERGATVHVLGNLITFRLRGIDTGMRFSMVDCLTAPGAGSPPHVQTLDEEAFHVLDGSYAFEIGGKTLIRGPGSVTVVPRGVPHAFRNLGREPARMLIVNWPADMHEAFFLAIGDPMAPGETHFPAPAAPDMARIAAAAAASGITLLPPPGA